MKTSRAYWEKRSGQALLDVLKDGDRLHARLGKDFKVAHRNIEKEISHLYAKHAHDNAISRERAEEIIRGDEYRVWRMSMEDYLAELADSKDQVLLLELNTLCMRTRVNRLEALEGEILAQMAKLAEREEGAVGDHLRAILEDGYYRAMYERYRYKDRKLFGLMQSHSVALSKANITAALTHPWSGRNYSQSIWKREHDVANRARALVTRNVLEGRSIDNLTREMADLMGRNYENDLRRLIHTETAYIKAQGDLLTYEKLEVEEYEYLATLDNKTSDACQELDGRHFPIEEAKPGVNYPPMHPHCRSTTIVYREDKDKDATRVARNEAGETYKVPADLTYKEWKESVEGNASKQADGEENILKGVPVIKEDGDMEAWLDSARAVAGNLGADVSEVKFLSKPYSEMPGANGYCRLNPDNRGTLDYVELVLTKDDKRPYQYRIKTAFHEAYHLGAKGRPHDIGRGVESWLEMEETFAEASAHYLTHKAGVPDLLGPSYSEKLVKILPRLKRMDKYKKCKTLIDFGKIAVEERAGGGSAEWQDLHAKVMSIELEKDYYLPYVDFAKKNREEIVQTFVDSLSRTQDAEVGGLKQMVHKDLDEAVRLLESGEDARRASSNTRMVYNHAIAYAFNKIGVF